MKMNNNLEWSYVIADIFCQLGVKYTCICTGNRNSALTMSFTDNNNFISTSHIDERSAGFFALGISKANNIPSIIITTSGTAIANLLPSIIEANLSKTPLIIITADRPGYLIDKGENQTINQKNIYGNHVRDFIDIGLPTDNYSDLSNKLVSTFRKCIGQKQPPGPVHINVPFEEPIVSKLIENFHSDIRVEPLSNNHVSDIDINHLNLKNALIVCGDMDSDKSLDSILKISEHLNAPILADPTSNLRYYKSHKNIISNYNLFLKDINCEFDTIIRFGRKPTSKLLNQIINNNHNVILVDKYPHFNNEATIKIQSDYNCFLAFIQSLPRINDNQYLKLLSSKQEAVNNYLQQIDCKIYNCEGILIKEILDQIEENTNVFIGNSMAIREMDDLTTNLNKRINILSNRGASGIDGLVSTALGICYQSSQNKNIAILGDLSFFHDMNGLLFALQHELDIKFVILNNNGGGIFSSLNIKSLGYSKFDEFWTTPLNLDIKTIADLYNIPYTKINAPDKIQNVLLDDDIKIIDYKISIDSSQNIKNQIIEELGFI